MAAGWSVVGVVISVDLKGFVQEALRYSEELIAGALVQLHYGQMITSSGIAFVPLRRPGTPAFVISQRLLQQFQV